MKTKERINKQKQKLQQSKNKIQLEEARIKERERKIRTRHLIEVGGLVAKANLDFLDTNTLYGALLSLSRDLNEDVSIIDYWTKIGKKQFELESKEATPIIITFKEQPTKELRDTIREHNLRWNKFRSEWYGNAKNFEELKEKLKAAKNDNKELEFNIEIIQ